MQQKDRMRVDREKEERKKRERRERRKWGKKERKSEKREGAIGQWLAARCRGKRCGGSEQWLADLCSERGLTPLRLTVCYAADYQVRYQARYYNPFALTLEGVELGTFSRNVYCESIEDKAGPGTGKNKQWRVCWQCYHIWIFTEYLSQKRQAAGKGVHHLLAALSHERLEETVTSILRTVSRL